MKPISTVAFRHDRRVVLTTGGLAALFALAGCGTIVPSGKGAGVSSSATSELAAIRRSNGLATMVADRQLEQAALQQSAYMANARRMVHTTGWGKDFSSRVKANGIKGAAAENIAEGRMDISRLFDMWMHSAPHRRNILDPRFTRFGLAYTRDAKKADWRYWSLVLGS